MVLVDPYAPAVIAAVAVGDEILEHLPSVAQKRKLDLGALLPVLAALPLEWAEAERYSEHEDEARKLMPGRDEEDWPTVALALSLTDTGSVAIWTQDKDFAASGLSVITTGELLDLLRP